MRSEERVRNVRVKKKEKIKDKAKEGERSK